MEQRKKVAKKKTTTTTATTIPPTKSKKLLGHRFARKIEKGWMKHKPRKALPTPKGSSYIMERAHEQYKAAKKKKK